MRRNIPFTCAVFFMLAAPASAQQLCLNEIMAAPSSGGAEWIELFNATAAPVPLAGWTLEDATGRPQPLPAVTVFPGGFLVLTEKMPLGGGLTVDADSVALFGDLPSLNNGGDRLLLRDASGAVIDSAGYEESWLGDRGVTLERVRSDRGAERVNWRACLHPAGATPGKRNSVSPADVDLAILSGTWKQDSVFIVHCSIGLQPPTEAHIEIHRRSDAGWELLHTAPVPSPFSADTRVAVLPAALPHAGRHALRVLLRCTGDGQPRNDTLRFTAVRPHRPQALIINEIMYAPREDAGEWIELANTEEVQADLSGLRVMGTPSRQGQRAWFSLPDALPPLGPGRLAVLASDSSVIRDFPVPDPEALIVILNLPSLGLGNDGDDLLLVNDDGTAIDSLRYSPEWHHPLIADTRGRSLELLHPRWHALGADAWSSCTELAGGTPGRRNSVYAEAPPGRTGDTGSMLVHPVPFSPDGDGFEDFCSVTCVSPFPENQVRLRIYDANGRLVRTLRNNDAMGRRATLLWDGLDDSGRRVRIGIYVLLLEMLNPRSNEVAAAKALAVVARRL